MSFGKKIGIASFLLLVFTFCCGKEITDEMHQACMTENGIDEGKFDKFNKSGSFQTDDRNLRCYLKCVLIGTEWMDAEGNLHAQELNDFDKKYEKNLDKCMKSAAGSDLCEKAYNFSQCLEN